TLRAGGHIGVLTRDTHAQAARIIAGHYHHVSRIADVNQPKARRAAQQPCIIARNGNLGVHLVCWKGSSRHRVSRIAHVPRSQPSGLRSGVVAEYGTTIGTTTTNVIVPARLSVIDTVSVMARDRDV